MEGYTVEIINPQTKEKLFREVLNKVLYERKANIHGACVKLLTDNQDFKEEWEDNFKFMNEDIRPHSKIFSVDDGGKLKVLYEPVSKTCIIKNCDYYGWVKSIALAAISDFFEEYHSIHRRYSVHGSAVDISGHSLIMIGPPGTGKTTLTYGLLLDENYNYISDDWIFIRMFDNGVMVYSSEKNSYIRNDISDIWKEYSAALNQVKLDKKQRGIADVKNIFNDRVRDSSTFISVVLLERNKNNPPFRKITPEEGVEFMERNDFCNPHQLIRSHRKHQLRKNFFRELFSKGNVYILNTIENPDESLERIKNLIK